MTGDTSRDMSKTAASDTCASFGMWKAAPTTTSTRCSV